MTTTTEVFWTYKGVVLNTLAWNIKTRGGSRMGTAEPRGENLMVPGQVGRQYLPKYRDSRIITLAMWVRGSDADGDRPVGRAALSEQFDANWETLANLFDDDGQFALVKRFRDGVGGFITATAMAEYAGGLDPDMSDEFKADFAPQLLLADPWFYGAEVSQAVNNVNFNPGGNRPTDRIRIDMVGTNTRVHFQGGTRWIRVDGTYTDLEVDVHEKFALSNGTDYVNGMVVTDKTTHDWMVLKPGTQAFQLTGGTSATVHYQPAWR